MSQLFTKNLKNPYSEFHLKLFNYLQNALKKQFGKLRDSWELFKHFSVVDTQNTQKVKNRFSMEHSQ